jgi:hypothetical protein
MTAPQAPEPTAMPFDRGSRTYLVSTERLREFGKLSWAERLRWVEESAQFVRMAQAALQAQKKPAPKSS